MVNHNTNVHHRRRWRRRRGREWWGSRTNGWRGFQRRRRRSANIVVIQWGSYKRELNLTLNVSTQEMRTKERSEKMSTMTRNRQRKTCNWLLRLKPSANVSRLFQTLRNSNSTQRLTATQLLLLIYLVQSLFLYFSSFLFGPRAMVTKVAKYTHFYLPRFYWTGAKAVARVGPRVSQIATDKNSAT